MSTSWSTEKKIQMHELFDGRLERFGVVEHILTDESSPDIRGLADGKSLLHVYPDDSGSVSRMARRSFTNYPIAILEAIAEAFDTQIYSEHQPQFWGYATQEEWDAVMEQIASENRDKFYEEVLKALKGEGHQYGPDTIGAAEIEIAKQLALKEPRLAKRENKDDLLTAINQKCNEAHSVVVTLDTKDIAFAKMLVTGNAEFPRRSEMKK